MAPVPFGKSPLERMRAIKPEQHRHRKKDTKANNVGSVWQEDMNQGGQLLGSLRLQESEPGW